MRPTRVAIIDGGGSNIASLRFALERLGAECALAADRESINSATHVILPGVGAAKPAMERLQQLDLIELIRETEKPLLGICLGMQLLASASAEEETECIGIFPGRARKLSIGPDAPVPNMGWCQTSATTNNPLLAGIRNGSWFYFVHSYALPVDELTVASATHQSAFAAVMARDNFYATQFHPERSSSAGAKLLNNFLSLRR